MCITGKIEQGVVKAGDNVEKAKKDLDAADADGNATRSDEAKEAVSDAQLEADRIAKSDARLKAHEAKSRRARQRS